MSIYLNPGNESFKRMTERNIYVDKSLLIEKVYSYAVGINPNICIARPRRFGKSTDANMLVAFFSKGCNSNEVFDSLSISKWSGYEKHINKHNVIHLDMQKFLSLTHDINSMIELINTEVIGELEEQYNMNLNGRQLSLALSKVYSKTNDSFIIIIDEWDCIFREFKHNQEAQKQYLDYLRLLLKEQSYVEMCYMTGILPIRKYGTHSALNMFDEISMLEQRGYAKFMGFTKNEVVSLCEKYNVDFAKMQEWYDGYYLEDGVSIYSPRSVVSAINTNKFSNYWSQTEVYDALKDYIDLNMDGLKDDIISMLVGEKVEINVRTFKNDMVSFESKDNVLTLLVHLGYLGYNSNEKCVYIPNNEVKDTFIDSISTSSWNKVSTMFKNANDLLKSTWDLDSKKVADYIQKAHYETSNLQYNDENALSYTISLAYITAKDYYTIVREFPTGKGFADMVFIPKCDKPAMVIELKYDKSVESGIAQIKNKEYYYGLDNYLDNLLLVSINYDKDTKNHECMIEKYSNLN